MALVQRDTQTGREFAEGRWLFYCSVDKINNTYKITDQSGRTPQLTDINVTDRPLLLNVMTAIDTWVQTQLT